MIYPDNAAEKLGFLDIKELIRSYCLSTMGRDMVDKIQVMTSFDQINKFLRQTNEFRNILLNDSPLPIQNFFDIKSLAEKARVEGTFLTEDEFFRVAASLTTVFAVIRYFSEREGLYPNLEALFEHLPVERSVLSKIDALIDPKGAIRPNASPALQSIISGIAKAEQEAHKKIDLIFKNARNSGWTADGNLTVRDGRLCIPVLSENKRKVRGFIHDESASGQTVYIEPEEVFQLNNTIRDLEFEKRREIIKLLVALTTELRPYIPLLLSYHGLLTKLDFVRAKALFAISIDAEMPLLVKEAVFDLVNARHPLLFLALKKDQQPVVPLNIRIDEEQRIIVVSGPNAGGKSVCMKTVGLLQIMTQAGLLVPADGHSRIGIFRQIFADIGDDQSIESDLSTYSAHLSKMKNFMEKADARTLILIDEFGTGTDPQFGGPIAEAVLEELNRKKARGVVTTHYSNLKTFANSTPGLENASMLFNNEAMQPLYILSLGKPGSSYAFEIAQKIGLNAKVLESAKNKIGTYQKKVDTLLVELERDKKELMDTRKDLEKREKNLKVMLSENEKLRLYLEENKKNILKEAKLEAQNIIKDANKLIENTIAGIRGAKADKEQTRNLRNNLTEELKKHEVKEKKAPKPAESADIRKGDWVKLPDSETIGQVIELVRDNLILAIGDLRSVVKKQRVEKLAGKSVPKEIRRSHSRNLTEDFSSFSTELDLRGKRGDEALYELEKYLDRAVMLGLSSLKIIHGKGDGILRKIIRQYLSKYPHTSRMEDEHADRGGDGITYVYLK